MEVVQVQELDQNESDEPAPTNDMLATEIEDVVRKSCCRYGSGCTHINDPTHNEKFWHPALPKLNREQLKSQFICNECGYAASQLKHLQMHLQRKTAWSNMSLVGCRINCLVDSREWHEGFVLQFHKSGKHFVEFRLANEKRWLIMKKIAFYILERPVVMNKDGSEFKDDDESDGLAPIEDNWVYCEDITLDYAFSQSVLFKIYGNNIQETGHLTRGHTCLTDADRLNAQYVKGSLLYGELLPRGVNKAFGAKRLDVQGASVLFDLGMGTGKILIQAFLQCKNLRYIFGIELSAGRYKLAEEALLKMVRLLGADSYHVQINPGKFIIVTEVVRANSNLDENGDHIGPQNTSNKGSNKASSNKSSNKVTNKGPNGANKPTNDHEEDDKSQDSDPGEEYIERVLHMQCGNMFDVKNIATADIVMMETDIPQELHARLLVLLSAMKDDAKVLTYLDLRRIWQNTHLIFKQLDVNRHQADRYPTSWSVQRGHHFFLWNKVSATQPEMNHSPSWEWGHNVNLGLSRLVSGTSSSATQNTPGGGTTDSPIAPNRTATPQGGNTLSRVSSTGSVGRAGLRYTSSDSVGASPAVTNEEYGGAEDRCMPYSIISYIFGGSGSGSGSNNKKAHKKVLRVKDLEAINDRAVVPVNADGSRVTTPRRIAVEPLHLPTRSGGTNSDSPSPRPDEDQGSPDLSPRTANTAHVHVTAAGTGSSAAQAPPPRNKYGSVKHQHRHRENDPAERITTMGLESVKLRTPRTPRESPRTKKKDKGSRSSRGSVSAVNAADVVPGGAEGADNAEGAGGASGAPSPDMSNNKNNTGTEAEGDATGVERSPREADEGVAPTAGKGSEGNSTPLRRDTSSTSLRATSRRSSADARAGVAYSVTNALDAADKIASNAGGDADRETTPRGAFRSQKSSGALIISEPAPSSGSFKSPRGAQAAINIELNSGPLMMDATPPSVAVKRMPSRPTSAEALDRPSRAGSAEKRSNKDRSRRSPKGSTDALSTAGAEAGSAVKVGVDGNVAVAGEQGVSGVLTPNTGSGKLRSGRSSSKKKSSPEGGAAVGANGYDNDADPQPVHGTVHAGAQIKQTANPSSRPVRSSKKANDSCTIS